ncbi:MAG: glycosyltransferase family 4 protein [Spirulinaceae cyanobacterium]
MDKPLKILMVLHIPWSRNLGGARVQLELAEEFRAMGHHVEKFDYHDAFPQAPSSVFASLLRPAFTVKAQAYVRQNAYRFDIIDAHQGNLPSSKKSFNFKGLLVTRSVGLNAFYEDFASWERKNYSQGNWKVRLFDRLYRWRYYREPWLCLRSLETCDLINVPNNDEKKYIENSLKLKQKCFVFPFGLSTQRQQDFTQAIPSLQQRLACQTVVFIGTWSPRKGSRDWSQIIKRICQKIPTVRFLFLGTGLSEAIVLKDLPNINPQKITVIPQYQSNELPQLLKEATVGAFPSYIEGFGFAVLEKLASGIPTVAYDVPGPREMLGLLKTESMVKAGDVEAFSQKVIEFLHLNQVQYEQLSQDCIEVSQQFSWAKIARDTLDVYQQFLTK